MPPLRPRLVLVGVFAASSARREKIAELTSPALSKGGQIDLAQAGFRGVGVRIERPGWLVPRFFRQPAGKSPCSPTSPASKRSRIPRI